jgi:hypothetical protein
MEFHDSLYWRVLLKYDGQFQLLIKSDHKNQTITNHSCGQSLTDIFQQVLSLGLCCCVLFLMFNSGILLLVSCGLLIIKNPVIMAISECTVKHWAQTSNNSVITICLIEEYTVCLHQCT